MDVLHFTVTAFAILSLAAIIGHVVYLAVYRPWQFCFVMMLTCGIVWAFWDEVMLTA